MTGFFAELQEQVPELEPGMLARAIGLPRKVGRPRTHFPTTIDAQASVKPCRAGPLRQVGDRRLVQEAAHG